MDKELESFLRDVVRKQKNESRKREQKNENGTAIKRRRAIFDLGEGEVVCFLQKNKKNYFFQLCEIYNHQTNEMEKQFCPSNE